MACATSLPALCVYEYVERSAGQPENQAISDSTGGEVAQQMIVAFLAKATPRRRAWAALALVTAVVAAGCAAHAGDTSRVGGPPAPDTGRRVAFVAQADDACRQFDAGLQVVAESTVGVRSLEGQTPQALSVFYYGLVPLADTYYREIAALDAPSEGRAFDVRLKADAYETMLLLSGLDVTGTAPPDTPFATEPADVRAHLTRPGGVEEGFREYGFTSCPRAEL